VLDATSISTVVDVLRPERDALVGMLRELGAGEWALPTECPSYNLKGVAAHVLGDDLSLLSRQRDEAENGLLQVAVELPGADFRTLLDTFNDRWVHATQFLSAELLIELLELAGAWTAAYYENVDPDADGEPVGLFGDHAMSSPFWHAIAREYLERWVHHSQIRRALERGPLDDQPFLEVGMTVAAAAFAGVEPGIPTRPDGSWSLGTVVLGDRTQAANILTKGLTSTQILSVVTGPPDAVAALAAFAGRTVDAPTTTP